MVHSTRYSDLAISASLIHASYSPEASNIVISLLILCLMLKNVYMRCKMPACSLNTVHVDVGINS